MSSTRQGDFSRDSFNRLKHFSRVLMQQGRVQLDADSNEQVSILLHYLQTLAKDLIGEHGGTDDGFKIEGLPSNNFGIQSGHYYVGGILCELDNSPIRITGLPSGESDNKWIKVLRLIADNLEFKKDQFIEIYSLAPGAPNPTLSKITDVVPATMRLNLVQEIGSFKMEMAPMARRVTTYMTQADYPVLMDDEQKLQNTNCYLVYIDVWERHITPIEDDNIREVALGVADTATRAKVVWQVKVHSKLPNDGDIQQGILLKEVNDNWAAWVDLWQPPNRGQLKVKGKEQPADDTNPCITSPDARYRGAENQLYRVEIHNGNWLDGSQKPTFKWSRENGSVVFPIRTLTGDKVVLEHLGRDERFGLKEQDWVEIVDDDTVLHGKPGIMAQVDSIYREEVSVTLLFDGVKAPSYTEDIAIEKHALLRRWDHKAGNPKKGGLNLEGV